VTSGGKTVVVDPALEAEFTVQSDVKEEDENAQGKWPSGPGSTYDQRLLIDKYHLLGNAQSSGTPTIPALPSHTSDHPTSMSPPLDHSMTPDSTSNARQSQLSMIAASANEMVPQGLTMDDDGMKMGQWNQQLSTQEQLLFDSLQEHDPSLTAATQRAASFPRPIAMNPNTQAKGFVNEFGNSTKPAKPKVRGRFSAERRREVQEVRKRGACIRCRMLKKPVRNLLIQTLDFFSRRY
jgi:hypothetical protein